MVTLRSLAVFLPALVAGGLLAQAAGPGDWLASSNALGSPSGPPRGADHNRAAIRQRLSAKEAADLERRLQSLYANLAPSVVRFYDPKRAGGGFSGVIVSPTGNILTCAHHDLAPGTKVVAELADGRRVHATILGSVKQEPGSRTRYVAADIGMARLDDQGPWPAAVVRPPGDLKPGDRCLALSYPNVHLPGQPPLLRFGRLLEPDALGRIRSSCRGQPGDSGGPLFDCGGRVIGVLAAMESLKTGVTLHSSVEAFRALQGRLRAGEAGEFEKQLPQGFEWRQEPTGWALRSKKASESPHSVEEATDRWGWEPAEALQATMTKARRSTVEILSGEAVIALGLIVGADGCVLTKGTALIDSAGPRQLTCRLADDRRFAARVLAGSSNHDLALVQVSADRLPAVAWGDTSVLKAGQLVASLGPDPAPLHYSVIAALRCKNPGIQGRLAVRVEPAPAGTRGVQFVGFPEERLDLHAVRDSLRPRDRITHLDDVATPTLTDFTRVRELRERGPDGVAGEWVKLTVERGGNAAHVFLPLVAGPAPIAIPWRDARWNLRRNGFPVVFCHDGAIAHDRCGGPVVDRSGQVVGVNIARVDPMRTFAIPSDVVQAVIADLRVRAPKGR